MTERGERRTRRRDPPAQPALSADAGRPRVRGVLSMAERKSAGRKRVRMRVRKVLGRVFLGDGAQAHCARVRGPSRFPRLRIQRRAQRLSALQPLRHGACCVASADAPVLLRSACRRPRATSPRLIDLLLVSTRRAAQAPYIIITCQWHAPCMLYTRVNPVNRCLKTSSKLRSTYGCSATRID